MERIEQLKQWLEHQPDELFLLFALGKEMMNKGDFKEAEKYFNEIVRIDPLYVGVYYHLGHLYITIDQPTRAKELFQKGIEITKQIRDQKSQSELIAALQAMEDGE